MRFLPGLILVVSLASATTAEARLFWQTYGSLAPAEGGGCTWNSNQDYFVPRYPSSGRYGIYSPCKSNDTTSPLSGGSPACKGRHPFHPGYCDIYGPCHYRRRNHVYGAYCGCQPQTYDAYCGSQPQPYGGCCGTSPVASGDSLGVLGCETLAPLYNVEPSQLDILGSIPVEGGGLISSADFSQLGSERNQQQLLLQQRALPLLQQGLPSFGLPISGQLTQPLTQP